MYFFTVDQMGSQFSEDSSPIHVYKGVPQGSPISPLCPRSKAKAKRIYRNVRYLHGNEPISLRTAVYVNITYGSVRGALRSILG